MTFLAPAPRLAKKFSFEHASIKSAVGLLAGTVRDCARYPAKIYALERIVNLFYLLAPTTKGQVAFCGYARLVRVRQLRQILPLSLASVRRHFVDRTPVRRKILKPTPKIFGVP